VGRKESSEFGMMWLRYNNELAIVLPGNHGLGLIQERDIELTFIVRSCLECLDEADEGHWTIAR
jgi:hypothetical protein